MLFFFFHCYLAIYLYEEMPFSEWLHLDQNVGTSSRQGSFRGPAREEEEGVHPGLGQVHGQADQGQVLWWERVQWGVKRVRRDFFENIFRILSPEITTGETILS